MSAGRVELISGPMFSGKTDTLIARIMELAARGDRVIAIKHSLDRSRGRGELVSHSGGRHPAAEVGAVPEISSVGDDFDVIAIDEAQFFDEGLVELVRSLRERGKVLVIAGLDFDYRREPFETVAALASTADVVQTRVAICSACGQVAEYTQRLSGGNRVPSTESRILVGGPGLYEPRCRNCHRLKDSARP